MRQDLARRLWGQALQKIWKSRISCIISFKNISLDKGISGEKSILFKWGLFSQLNIFCSKFWVKSRQGNMPCLCLSYLLLVTALNKHEKKGHTCIKQLVLILIKQFSIECRKTKSKVITLANYKGHRQSSEPIKTRSKINTCSWHKARENVHK